jgi:hypothetical protein
MSVAFAANGSAKLLWTAPGDDGLVGRATVYDIRYSTSPITAANFLSATPVSGVPAPKIAGSAESFTITNLLPGTGYYIAMRTGDEVPNWSAISNIILDTAVTAAYHSNPLTLSLSPPWPNPARQTASWSYTLPEAGNMEIVAFDIGGRRIRSIVRDWKVAGQGDVVWDLRDDGGRSVPSGVYMVRATIGGRTFVKRLVVTH